MKGCHYSPHRCWNFKNSLLGIETAVIITRRRSVPCWNFKNSLLGIETPISSCLLIFSLPLKFQELPTRDWNFEQNHRHDQRRSWNFKNSLLGIETGANWSVSIPNPLKFQELPTRDWNMKSASWPTTRQSWNFKNSLLGIETLPEPPFIGGQCSGWNFKNSLLGIETHCTRKHRNEICVEISRTPY